MRKVQKSSLIVLLLSFYSLTLCQNPQCKSELRNLSKSEYVIVKLSPEFLSYSESNTNDLRISDNDQNEVAYLPYLPEERIVLNEFTEVKYRLITLPKHTEVLIENPDAKTYNCFIMFIKNSEVLKRAKLTGSDNGMKWYSIIDDLFFDMVELKSNTDKILSLNFPISNYKFLKITLNDSSSLPYNILKLGINHSIERTFISLDTLKTFKYNKLYRESKKPITYEFNFDRPNHFTNISFNINDKYYNRTARLYKISTVAHKHKTKRNEELIQSITLRSDRSRNYFLGENYGKKYKLVIDPVDNSPLEIIEIVFLVKPKFILTKLNKNEIYTLSIGDSTLGSPNYDLSELEGLNIHQMEMIFPSPKLDVVSQTSGGAAEIPFYSTKKFMWICIVLSMIFLLYFSVTMLKEMKTND